MWWRSGASEYGWTRMPPFRGGDRLASLSLSLYLPPPTFPMPRFTQHPPLLFSIYLFWHRRRSRGV